MSKKVSSTKLLSGLFVAGGVKSGRDAFEHILCGASMVQVGTALQKEGVAVFDRITKELKEIMEEKGYETLEDFRGKLHYID